MLGRLLLVPAFLFAAVGSCAAEPAITVKSGKNSTDFMLGDKLITRYHYGPEVAKPYFWPMHSPEGVPVTRAWPMEKGAAKETTDHVHQKSAWFCHGDVIPEGLELKSKIKNVVGVDFWSEGKGHGLMQLKTLEAKGDGTIVTTNDWQTAEGQTIINESRTISLRRAAAGYLVIVAIELKTEAYPIVFGDTKEGSFGVRVNDQIRLSAGNSKSKMVNSNGKSGEKECWGYLADWCDYSGEIDGKIAGVAVFDDPGNASRACWHARGYGLMAANPFGRSHAGFPARKGDSELVRIPKGGALKLRYGIYLHDGDASVGKTAQAFEDFARK